MKKISIVLLLCVLILSCSKLGIGGKNANDVTDLLLGATSLEEFREKLESEAGFKYDVSTVDYDDLNRCYKVVYFGSIDNIKDAEAEERDEDYKYQQEVAKEFYNIEYENMYIDTPTKFLGYDIMYFSTMGVSSDLVGSDDLYWTVAMQVFSKGGRKEYEEKHSKMYSDVVDSLEEKYGKPIAKTNYTAGRFIRYIFKINDNLYVMTTDRMFITVGGNTDSEIDAIVFVEFLNKAGYDYLVNLESKAWK